MEPIILFAMLALIALVPISLLTGVVLSLATRDGRPVWVGMGLAGCQFALDWLLLAGVFWTVD